MDLVKLNQQVEQGYIKAVPHGNLTLYNYTQYCQFDRAWTPETLACRGLVMRGDAIVARPFRKFFNLEEHQGPLPAETPELATKHDGSLVIVFYDGDNWRACTRGAWENPQIDAAYRWLEEHCHKLDPAFTWLFELVAPWNRIVVDYPDERMILLGVVHPQEDYCMSYAETYRTGMERGLEPVEYVTQPIETIDRTAPFNNSEGYVARYSNGFRVKIKYDDYKRIHAMLSTASTKKVVEVLASGKREALENMPDEFMDWIRAEEARVTEQFNAVQCEARLLADRTTGCATQKDKALIILAGAKHLQPIAFSMINGKDWKPSAWRWVSENIDNRLWRPGAQLDCPAPRF